MEKNLLIKISIENNIKFTFVMVEYVYTNRHITQPNNSENNWTYPFAYKIHRIKNVHIYLLALCI